MGQYRAGHVSVICPSFEWYSHRNMTRSVSHDHDAHPSLIPREQHTSLSRRIDEIVRKLSQNYTTSHCVELQLFLVKGHF
ncbi:hypothetical protein Y032_0174g468 [Ancylostoma ceylanicum]|uniref:Uncharacterized protein n=1 Tax=Ancylostoma ceylanicum TaxID=53326 RepID=A0A016SV15_9BILA|nr:hypothetical protein Y032_0174g468 [Ancylostoma ceylanicum]